MSSSEVRDFQVSREAWKQLKKERHESRVRGNDRIWSVNTVLIRSLVFFNVALDRNGGILDIRLSGCGHFRSASSYHFPPLVVSRECERMNDRPEWFVVEIQRKGERKSDEGERGGGGRKWQRNGSVQEGESKLRSLRRASGLAIFNNIQRNEIEAVSSRNRGDAIIQRWQKEIPVAGSNTFSRP